MMHRFDSHLTNDLGYTYALTVNGKNILTKWGIEFSDSESFFIHGQHGNSPMELLKLERSDKHTHAEFRVHLRTTKIHITLDETFSPEKIIRKYTLTPARDTFMQDIAISQAFKKDAFHHIRIGKEKVPFTGLERNHQFPGTQAIMVGDDFDLEITLDSQHASTGFAPHFYGRTAPKSGWVVHARLFPQTIARKAIVWCNPHWNRKIPFSDWLVNIKPLTDYLWNVGEDPTRVGVRTFGLISFGLTDVKGKKDIVMTETIRIVPKTKKGKKESQREK